MRIVFAILALIYLIPTIHWILAGVRKIFPRFGKAKPNRFLDWVSNIEYTVLPFRHYFVGFPIILSVIYFAVLILQNSHDSDRVWFFVVLVFYAHLVIWIARRKVITDLKMAEYLRCFPHIHPDFFFLKYKRELALGGGDFGLKSAPTLLHTNEVDFKSGHRPIHKISLLFKGIFDSAYLAHFSLNVVKYIGKRYAFEVFDSVASLWGKRVLQISKNAFSITGQEKLAGKKGKFILIFNHKSSFDFALTHLAFSQIRVDGRHMRPRFILAKDHFKDNRILHDVLGIGKICEAVDMVFIARKDRQKSIEDLKKAARFLIDKNIDLAIYPQGTRAEGNVDRAFKRRDAGYYTTFTKHDLISPLAHIRKGTSYLVLDVLQELQQSGKTIDLNLVFVGIKGAATTFPKDHFKIQTENNVDFIIGDVVTLSPSALTDSFKDSKEFLDHINHLIDDKLKTILGIHEALEQRYLTELKGQFRFDQDKIDAVASSLHSFSQKSDRVYHILDRIYSLPLVQWNSHLSQLSQLLLERSDETRLEALLKQVSEELLKN